MVCPDYKPPDSIDDCLDPVEKAECETPSAADKG
jgi:hypothetical protein